MVVANSLAASATYMSNLGGHFPHGVAIFNSTALANTAGAVFQLQSRTGDDIQETMQRYALLVHIETTVGDATTSIAGFLVGSNNGTDWAPVAQITNSTGLAQDTTQIVELTTWPKYIAYVAPIAAGTAPFSSTITASIISNAPIATVSHSIATPAYADASASIGFGGVAGAGSIQHGRETITGVATQATATFNPAFADANYTMLATPEAGTVNAPVVIEIRNKAAGTADIHIGAAPGGVDTNIANWLAIHD